MLDIVYCLKRNPKIENLKKCKCWLFNQVKFKLPYTNKPLFILITHV